MTTRTQVVQIEVTTWVTKHVGGDGSGTRMFDEPFTPGDTVRTSSAASRDAFPSWMPPSGTPTTPISANPSRWSSTTPCWASTMSLDSPLEGGERITLLGQFMGGR